MADMPVPSDPVQAERLARVLAASKFFEHEATQHPEVLAGLLESGDLDRRYPAEHLLEMLGNLIAGCDDEGEFNRILRQLRRREMLRIIWRDFNRQVATMDTTRDLSLLAEAVINVAQGWWHERLVALHGEPMDDDGKPQQLNVMVMGKLGARELNLSSDIDLIFTYPRAGQTQGGKKILMNQEFFTRLGQKIINSIDQQTVDGFVFRVDMRLRPYGESGALVCNFDSMEQYYQEQGRDWERYALIKARVVSGDMDEAEVLMTSLRPFVYRKYIDFSVIESLRSMKSMISAEVKRRGLDTDVKLGPGGIREIEFIAQCFQLIRGGRNAALRNRELLWVLGSLAQENELPAKAVDELTAAYLFLRDTEHAIQGYEDKQTQKLPESDEAKAALLKAMDFACWDAFMAQLDFHRGRVMAHFAGLIAPAEGEENADGHEQGIWPDGLETEALTKLGYMDAESVAESLIKLRDSSLMQHLQPESKTRLDAFMPMLLRVCGADDFSDLALLRLMPMVQALARRSAYLVLLMENPQALERLVMLCGASPWIAEQLTQHPVLLDELLQRGNLTAEPDRASLATSLEDQLYTLAPDDEEGRLEALCYFKSAQQLQVAVSEATSLLPLMRASDTLTWLAELIIEQVLLMAWHNLAAKHGTPIFASVGQSADGEAGEQIPRGFAVLGFGKMGGLEMGYSSDLDLVFVHETPAVSANSLGQTDGDKPIDNNMFYIRLAQRVVHLLSSRTHLGQLYEVDLRLRPFGDSGPFSAIFTAYEEYEKTKAWTWEHQALVRSRFVAGDKSLGKRCEQVRKSVSMDSMNSRNPTKLKDDVVSMRHKMRDNLLSAEARKGEKFDIKHSEGGMVDIEFIVQHAVLAHSAQYSELTKYSDNIRIIETLASLGLLEEAEASALKEAYIAYRIATHELALQHQPAIVDGRSFKPEREAVMACWQRLLGHQL